MGNCSSCVGRRRDSFDEVSIPRSRRRRNNRAIRDREWTLTLSLNQDDEAQHLFDDPNNMHYGSFDQQHMAGQEDPQEVQREIEALQRVVARTSEYISRPSFPPPPFPPCLPPPLPLPFLFPETTATERTQG